MPIRVVIADDQALFRAGIRTLLSIDPDIAVVGEASDGEQAVRVCEAQRALVVLMDLRMPVVDGIAAIKRLRVSRPACRAIALTTFGDDESVFEALRAGAVGYLLKDAPAERLRDAIRAADRGEMLLSPVVASRVVAELNRLTEADPARPVHPALAELSEREREVLRLVGHGATNKDIAVTLSISEGTVKNHMTKIFDKLGLTDRTQAALKAREAGLV